MIVEEKLDGWNNNLIKTCWNEDELCNGLDAMILANESYKNPISNKSIKILDKISNYNLIDCKIMWEILNSLRSHNQLNN